MFWCCNSNDYSNTPRFFLKLETRLTCFNLGEGKRKILSYKTTDKNGSCPKDVIIPYGITDIAGDSFSDRKLTLVIIPNSVTYIGNNAFSNNKLTSVTIPNNVTFIGNHAFYNNQLISVTSPNNAFIGIDAFSNNQLDSEIPSSFEVGLSPCINGEQRLADHILLHTTSDFQNAYPISISGPFSQGSIVGRFDSIYIGASRFGDLIVVSKITDGFGNILGFNINISMCSFQQYMTNERPPHPDSFQAPYGIVVDNSLSCGSGSVLAAKGTILQTPAQNGLPPFSALTTFSSLSCQ